MNIEAVIFDVDQTLVDSTSAAAARQRRDWPSVYRQIHRVAVFAGMVDLWERLRGEGALLAVVTNSPRPYCERVLRHAGLRPDQSVCWHDTRAHKPDAEPMRLVLARLGLSASSCISVGDSVDDVRSSLAAGIPAIAATWGGGDGAAMLAAGASGVTNRVEELATLLLDPGS
ncbi:MAG: HAD family hydrolase [Planctomycetota bacterium]